MVCKFLSSEGENELSQSKGSLKVDPACLQERFYFGDTVLPLFESGIPLVRQRLQALPDADNITIAYPDEGAWKRFHYQFGDYPEVCSL